MHQQFPRAEVSNDTHESTTGPEAKLYRKGKSQPAQLSCMGHATIENRHGLVVQADATAATGRAEREVVLAIDRHDPGSERRITVGADKAYVTSDFVADLRRKCVTPHWHRKPRARRSTRAQRRTRATR